MLPPKLHLDENLSPRLAKQLRKHGFDVISSQEAELLSLSDRDQLSYAVSQERGLVTINFADFITLHNEYLANQQSHWGIILTTAEPFSVLLHRLLRLLNTVPATGLQNSLLWLNDFR